MGTSDANRQSPLGLFPGQPMLRLYDRVVEVLRARHYSRPTEQTYPASRDGYDIRTVEELLGHSEVKTTMIYTHVLNRGPAGVSSPVDGPAGHRGGFYADP